VMQKPNSKDSKINLDSKDNWIAIDILGGDEDLETKTADYKGDAALRNLEAWKNFVIKNYTRLIQEKVGFVLVGRREEILRITQEALEELKVKEFNQHKYGNASSSSMLNLTNSKIQDSSENLSFLQIVHCEQQAPMNGKNRKRGNSMEKIAKLQQEEKIVAGFSNGSTKDWMRYHMLLRKKELGRPFIAKELLRNIWFGDNGAIPHPQEEDYKNMFRTLKQEWQEKNPQKIPKVSILPDDDLCEESIKNSIQKGGEIIDFDPLAFLGLRGEKPDIILANGFIGNIYLKCLEAFIKNPKQWFRLKPSREKILNQLQVLEKISKTSPLVKGDLGDSKSVEKNWEIPKEKIEKLGRKKFAILANGTESSKGTKELQTLFKKLKENYPDQFIGFVEPEDLLCKSKTDIVVFSTPASKKVVEGFLQESFLKLISSKPKEFLKVIKEIKKSISMAHLEHMDPEKSRDVCIGHGSAKVKATTKIFQYLFEEFIK